MLEANCRSRNFFSTLAKFEASCLFHNRNLIGTSNSSLRTKTPKGLEVKVKQGQSSNIPILGGERLGEWDGKQSVEESAIVPLNS